MITGAEVGSVFMIEDRASGVLNLIADAADRVAASAKEASDALIVLGDSAPFAGILANLDSLTAGLDALGDVGARETKNLSEGFKFAAAEVDGVRSSVASLTIEIQALGAATKTASEESEESGGLGALFGGLGKKMGGFFSLPAMATEFTGFEAIKHGMEMEDTINRMMVSMNVPVGANYMETDMAQEMQRQIEQHSRDWGIPLEGMQHAALAAARNLAPLSPEQRMRIMPSLLDFVGLEVTGKPGTSAEEAASAGIGLAHQLKDYTPEQIEPIFKVFAQLSRGTETSLPNLSRSFSYALPLLTSGLNMDPTELMAMGVATSQMGLGSKSGTWLSSMFSTPFTADLTSKRQSQRRDALEELGLFEHGKATTTDPFQFIETMSAHLDKVPQEQKLKLFMHAFGLQGAREAAIMTDPAVLKNLMGLATSMRTAPSAEENRAEYAESPLFKFHKAESEFSIALTHLGETVMPAATLAINLFSKAAEGLAWIFGTGVTADAVRKQSNEVKAYKDAHGGQAPPPTDMDWSKPSDKDAMSTPGWKQIANLFRGSDQKPLPSTNAAGINVSQAMRTQPAGGGVTVNGGVNIYGANTTSPEDFANNFMAEINRKVAHSSITNISAGEGTYSSPFTNSFIQN